MVQLPPHNPGSVVFLALALSLIRPALPTQSPFVIADVDVVGARRYSRADVVKVSGLTPGRSVTVADLNAAMERMAGTGLFKQLNYRYATLAGKTTVTLEIEEPEWTMPVIFDNFVWFSDEALAAALRESVPSFDGTAPVTAGFTEFLTRELQKVLQSRQLPGTVVFMPHGTIAAGAEARLEGFLFAVNDPSPKACSVTFPGAAAIKDSELQERLGIGPGTDYSKTYVVSASKGTLTNLYRQRGYWKATIEAPVATLATGTCAGSAITVTVNEGAAYAFEGADWSGNAALSVRDLEKLLPLGQGDVASITKLDEGLRHIQHAYQSQGYIQQRAAYAPRLNDATSRARFDVRIEEGPQFRTGTLSFPGLAAKDAETLSKRWRLKSGDVFDASYPAKFVLEEIRPRLGNVAPPVTRLDVDEKARIVNVAIAFGGA